MKWNEIHVQCFEQYLTPISHLVVLHININNDSNYLKNSNDDHFWTT